MYILHFNIAKISGEISIQHTTDWDYIILTLRIANKKMFDL